MGIDIPLAGPSATYSAVALIDAVQDRVMSYGELEHRVGEVADAVRSLCGPRPVVACELDRTVDDIVWYLGVLAAGGVPLLVDPHAPDVRKERLYARFPPSLRPAEPDGGACAGGEAAVLVAERAHFLAPGPVLDPHPDLSLLMSTSGSTASPKLVRLSATAVTSNAAAIAAALDLAPGERAMANLPLTFSYGLSVLHSHLAAGASVVVSPSSVAQGAFWASLDRYGCTSVAGVPATYRVMTQLRLLDRLGPVRTLTQAGGRLDQHTGKQLQDHTIRTGRQLVVMYGQTEATARITVLAPDDAVARWGTVGRPIQGSVRIVPGGTGEVGEIAYQGPNVMMGYAHTAEDVSAPDELGSHLLTGDLGDIDADGYLYVAGRRGRFAKVDGNRVNLDEIEAAVAHLAIQVMDGDDGLLLVHEQESVDEQGLAGLLDGLFRVQRRSWVLHRVGRIPMTANGKVDRRALAELVTS